jgi:hypothetical protein
MKRFKNCISPGVKAYEKYGIYAVQLIVLFLPLICQCLLLNDELYRHMLTFVSKCLSHSLWLMMSVTVHAMFFAQSTLLGQNVILFYQRYNFLLLT